MKTAQTVIVAHNNAKSGEIVGGAGRAGEDRLTLIGCYGHDTISDLDVAKGDIFTYEGARWEIVYVDKTAPGRIRATAEGRQ